MACPSCGRGFHEECGDPCCCSEEKVETLALPVSTGTGKVGRPLKEEISTSAGRKRAAEIYPIDKDAPCDWQRKANCGGGLYPIVGCLNGKQQNRHHGPVKDTWRNERHNIHLICAVCHNKWHEANDEHYDKEKYELLPHQPREATAIEMVGLQEDGKSESADPFSPQEI